MTAPTQEEIKRSLSKLKPEPAGKKMPPLFQQDLRNIAWAFTFIPNQNMKVSKGQNEDSVLHLNGQDRLCPSWGAVPGQSAASSLRQVGPVINRARYGRNDVIPSAAFGFDEQNENHSLQNAMTLADFSHMAYFEPVYVEEQLRRPATSV